MAKSIKNQPYGIDCFWDSKYLCKQCGELLYYNNKTKEECCLNTRCQEYPTGVEIYSTEDADLKTYNLQKERIETGLGDIVKTCDYDFLSRALLERRRLIVRNFFTSGMMNIEDFLEINDILLFIQNFKSLGIRKNQIVLRSLFQLYKQHWQHLKFLEDIKEGRYLLAKKPNGSIFRMKYYDVIIIETWSGYGLVNLQKGIDVGSFRYHEVIEKLLSSQIHIDTSDLAPYFERLWPLVISFQYLVKTNSILATKYNYSVTTVDLANLLSIYASLNDDEIKQIPLMNLLAHHLKQPLRDKNISEFINLISGKKERIPIGFLTNGSILVDRKTLFLFIILLFSQHMPSIHDAGGRQIISKHKQEAGDNFEKLLINKLEKIGYHCLPQSTRLAGKEYDVIAISEKRLEILLIETKFKDPSPSSLSKDTLIEQELIYPSYGLLPEAIKHQQRYELFIAKYHSFKDRLNLKNDIKTYSIKAYFVTKYSPLISAYGNVLIYSEEEFLKVVRI